MRTMSVILCMTTLHSVTALNLGGLISDMFSGKKVFDPPVVMGDESIMSKKAHGTSATPVQKNLRWSCSEDIAVRRQTS